MIYNRLKYSLCIFSIGFVILLVFTKRSDLIQNKTVIPEVVLKLLEKGIELHPSVLKYLDAEVTYGDETWKLPSASVIAIVKDCVIGPSGVVVDKHRSYTFDHWYWGDHKDAKNDHKNAKKRLNNIKKIENNKYITFVQIWQDVFSHITFDTLPKLSFTCDFITLHSDVVVLVKSSLQRDMIKLHCDIPNGRFKILRSYLIAQRIYIPQFLPAMRMGLVPPNTLKPLGIHQKSKKIIVLYLQRAKGRVRSVTNENELFLFFESIPDIDFIIFKPKNNWMKDREVIQKANILIGPHGGAWANMIFAAQKTIVIEFIPLRRMKKNNKNERPCYFGLAHALGLKYISVEVRKFSFDSGPMEIVLHDVKNALVEALSGLLNEYQSNIGEVTIPANNADVKIKSLASLLNEYQSNNDEKDTISKVTIHASPNVEMINLTSLGIIKI